MKVINLCPHDVHVYNENGQLVKCYEQSGQVARVAFTKYTVDYVDGFPVEVRRGKKVVNLPEPEEGTIYIVSEVTLNECRDRMDLIAPGRKYKVYGKTVGCTTFMSNR